MDQRKRQALKVSEQKGSITLQGDRFAVQALFDSSMLEVCNYLQQIEKYRYRASLSSINLKVEQFDEYYSEIREKIDALYHSFLYNSLTIFEDLIIAIKLSKVQMWHQQAMICQGLRNSLYSKKLDPYNFDPTQLDAKIKQALQTLNVTKNEVNNVRNKIEEMTSNLKQIQSERMQDMFCGKVTNPYVAFNKKGIQVDPSAIFSSYITYLRIKMERADQALLRKHFIIHQDVLKFGQALYQHSLKYQATAASVIKSYSQSTNNQYETTQIVPVPHLETRKQQINADQLSTGKQHRTDSKPSLINKQIKVQFKAFNRVNNMENSTGQIIQLCDNEERGKLESTPGQGELAPKDSPFISYTEKRKIHHRDYHQHYDYQRRIRDDQLRYAYRQMRQRQRQRQRVIVRRVIRTSVAPAPWSQFSEYKSPYFYFIQSRTQKEKVIWDIKEKEKKEEPQFLTYDFMRVPQIKPKQKQQKQKIEQQMQEERRKQQFEDHMFESKRIQEESSRLAGLKHLIDSKTYQQFLAISKMQNFPQAINKKCIKRYGIYLEWPVDCNQNADIDKFFYYYFKERYYREHLQVKENADNPIIYLDHKKVNMGSARKVVAQLISSITKRMINMPFFFLWSRDLIVYRQVKIQGVVKAEFECYSFGTDGNCQKIMYEVRRRSSMVVKEIIHREHQKQDEDQQVISKIEIAHRLLYNRHRPLPSLDKSLEKGLQIANELLQKLQYE